MGVEVGCGGWDERDGGGWRGVKVWVVSADPPPHLSKQSRRNMKLTSQSGDNTSTFMGRGYGEKRRTAFRQWIRGVVGSRSISSTSNRSIYGCCV